MGKLTLEFIDGTTKEIAFRADSTLTVETPDGPNGVIRGAWSEIADVTFEDGDDPVVEPTPVERDVVAPIEPASDATVEQTFAGTSDTTTTSGSQTETDDTPAKPAPEPTV